MSNPLFDTKETSCAPCSTPAKTIFAYMIFTYNIYIQYHIRQYGYAEIGVNTYKPVTCPKTCPKPNAQEICNDI